MAVDLARLEKFCRFPPDGISDALIEAAIPFEGHVPEYLKWPACYWKEPGRVPDWDLARNAWHVRYLADAMAVSGRWVGAPLRVYPCLLHIHDGNHRFRAVRWLEIRGVVVDVGEVVVVARPCWRPECRLNDKDVP